MKNQLMQMMDGISSDDSRMVVIVRATNRPDMLDNAALRRLTKRVLVPLPDFESRLGQVRLLLRSHRRSLGSDGEVPIDGEGQQAIARMTEGWNCSDLKVLCAKAAEVSYDETVMEYGVIDKVRWCCVTSVSPGPGPEGVSGPPHGRLHARLRGYPQQRGV
eukprot:Polyplicarium_translucidae@DN3158_c0_g1_i11.p4